MKFLLLISFLVLTACDKGSKTPEGLIKNFVKEVTSSKVDMDFFKKNTTGELLKSVEELEPKELEELITSSSKRLAKVKKPQVEISNKVCAGEKCTVTYIVKFDFDGNKEGVFESEVKKIATVIKDGEYWKVSEVSNVKTYYNAQKPIDTSAEDIPSAEEEDEESE